MAGGYPVCSCAPGLKGDPFVECKVDRYCTRDSHCLESQYCDAELRQCNNVCQDDTCIAPNAVCESFKHHSLCVCKPPYEGIGSEGCKVIEGEEK